MDNKRAPFFYNKNGVFYFIRRVPLELQHYYKFSRISFSLKTRDAKIASSRSKQLASRLDDFWLQLRMQEDAMLGRFLKKTSTTLPVEAVVNVSAVSAIVQSLRRMLLSLSNLQQPAMQHLQGISQSIRLTYS